MDDIEDLTSSAQVILNLITSLINSIIQEHKC